MKSSKWASTGDNDQFHAISKRHEEPKPSMKASPSSLALQSAETSELSVVNVFHPTQTAGRVSPEIIDSGSSGIANFLDILAGKKKGANKTSRPIYGASNPPSPDQAAQEPTLRVLPDIAPLTTNIEEQSHPALSMTKHEKDGDTMTAHKRKLAKNRTPLKASQPEIPSRNAQDAVFSPRKSTPKLSDIVPKTISADKDLVIQKGTQNTSDAAHSMPAKPSSQPTRISAFLDAIEAEGAKIHVSRTSQPPTFEQVDEYIKKNGLKLYSSYVPWIEITEDEYSDLVDEITKGDDYPAWLRRHPPLKNAVVACGNDVAAAITVANAQDDNVEKAKLAVQQAQSNLADIQRAHLQMKRAYDAAEEALTRESFTATEATKRVKSAKQALKSAHYTAANRIIIDKQTILVAARQLGHCTSTSEAITSIDRSINDVDTNSAFSPREGFNEPTLLKHYLGTCFHGRSKASKKTELPEVSEAELTESYEYGKAATTAIIAMLSVDHLWKEFKAKVVWLDLPVYLPLS